MTYRIEAAAGCNKGRIRSNNEDNLFFAGKTLEQENEGLRRAVGQRFSTDSEVCFCVFDGMGGEESGEVASYTAARAMKEIFEESRDYLSSPKKTLERICMRMNEAVCNTAESLEYVRMGSTMVSLLFVMDEVYMCNIGDSRAFRLRDNEWLQLSQDHTERLPANMDEKKHKPRLTQHLGISPDELTLEPYIAKGDLRRGDQYLLCSDGLTDMLTNVEICALIKEERNTKKCVERLINLALEHGGRDNVTAILCRVK